MAQVTPKQKRIVKAKIKGKTNKEIAKVEFPNSTPASQTVQLSRELSKPHVAQYYEQTKLIALKKHNITWDRIIQPISDALEATKQNQFTGEVDPDMNIRLRASKQAMDLIGADKEPDKLQTILKIDANMDEVEMLKAIHPQPTT